MTKEEPSGEEAEALWLQEQSVIVKQGAYKDEIGAVVDFDLDEEPSIYTVLVVSECVEIKLPRDAFRVVFNPTDIAVAMENRPEDIETPE